MFYWRYLRAELTRRGGRTLLAALALAVGVGLVIDVAALGSALHTGQSRVLDPLGSIGSDLLVTRSPHTTAADASAQLDSDMQSVVTDLSKLGNPGDHFVHDFFLPSGEPALPAGAVERIRSIPGVAQVSTGLTLQVMHQEGTVPRIVAELQQAARTVTVNQSIAPLTPAEQSQVQACIQAAQQSGHTDEATFMGCLPQRFRTTQLTVTIPAQTIQQVVSPPQTDIQSTSYTIGGVDPSSDSIGIVTAAQVAAGRFLEPGMHDAMLAAGYAQRRGIALGQTFVINGTAFDVVGLVKPPLAGQAADAYVSLSDLQELSARTDRVNEVLVRAAGAADVARVAAAILSALPDAQVTASGDLAAQVSGSLVDARNLVDRMGAWLAVVVITATSAITCMLMLAAVGRRVRELGTLRAIGWSSARIVRQVIGESSVIGLIGGVAGVGLGIAALAVLLQLIPPLQAVAPAGVAPNPMFGLGDVVRPSTETIHLHAAADPMIAGAAVMLAASCGLLAGVTAAVRAARLRPADALRELG